MPGPDVPALRMASRSGFAGSGAGSEAESETRPVLPSTLSTLLRITSLRLCIPRGASSRPLERHSSHQ
eukprot:8548316-Pyramimonas_sp.AAC.1